VYANNLSIAQHFPLADHIIILDKGGKIVEQGTWENLRAEAGYISKVVVREKEDGEDKPRDRIAARDKIHISAEEPDSNIQDITRQTGDITLYSTFPLFLRKLLRVTTNKSQTTISAPSGQFASSSSLPA
jgi:ABC-type multidrug transport system ATPase subunit